MLRQLLLRLLLHRCLHLRLLRHRLHLLLETRLCVSERLRHHHKRLLLHLRRHVHGLNHVREVEWRHLERLGGQRRHGRRRGGGAVAPAVAVV